MSPAAWPRANPRMERLLHLDRSQGHLTDSRIMDLPNVLNEGDVLVVNDAATLPASYAVTVPSGRSLEARLAGEGPGGHWRVILLGEGNWHQATSERSAPDQLSRGDRIGFGTGLTAVVTAVSPISPRLLEVRFDKEEEALWTAL